MKNFVSTKWLQQHLEDEDIIIVDCRGDLLNDDYGKDLYKKGHIKNAVFADLKKVMSSEEKQHGGRNPLPSLESFKENIEKLGITNNSLVVAYDELKIAGAARFCWMLRHIGHTNNYVLDGGINKWNSEKIALCAEEKQHNNEEKFSISLNKEIEADMEYVKNSLNKENVLLVDSRTAERYNAIFEPIDKIAGHIKGAKNFYWKHMLKEDGTVDENKVLEKFSPLKKYDHVITYCGSGIDAAFNFLLLDEINIKAKLYIGSWSDWITYEENS